MNEIAGFETELVRAVQSRIGSTAIFHQNLAGNCFEGVTEACMEVGLGPEEYDCSGLMAASICDVKGIDVSAWPAHLRHVRDMWAASEDGSDILVRSPEVTVASLITTPRYYDIGGRLQAVAGHIGLVTGIDGEDITVVHSNSKDGAVEVSNWGSIVVQGSMRLNPDWFSTDGLTLVE